MKQRLQTLFNILKWLIILGLFYYVYLLFRDGTRYFIDFPVSPGWLLGISLIPILVVMAFVLKNQELAIITFSLSMAAFMIILGLGSFLNLELNRILFVTITAALTFGLGLILMRSLSASYQWIRILKSYHLVHPYLSVSMLLLGLILMHLIKSDLILWILFFILGILVILLVLVGPVSRAYRAFFTDRTVKGLDPLTFLKIVQTLWTYFVLVFGSMLLGILGLLFYGMIFLDLERRKSIFHFCLMAYCRFYIWIIPVRTTLINPLREDFKKPAVIISNHQSLIDMPILFRMYPKLIILTNEWVYNSPIFGHISKLADFYPVTSGIDRIMDKLKNRIEAGYSIIVLPEGTRSLTQEIQRFHRGAFYIAEKLQLDIIPILLCGTGNLLKKGEFWGEGNHVIQRIYRRIPFDDPEFGSSYSRRPKLVRKYLRKEFDELITTYRSIRALREKRSYRKWF